MMIRTLAVGALAILSLSPGSTRCAPSNDRATPDSVVDAFYAILSADARVTRPWWRLRDISAPDASFIEVGHGTAGGVVQPMTADAFIGHFGARLNGRALFEVDCYRLKAPFADVATVISYYETRPAASAKPLARGLNSFQLVRTDDGWRIETLLREEAAATASAPAGYPGCSAK